MAASATDNINTVTVSEDGAPGLPGADGADGAGFNDVRKSKLDNPIFNIFKKNKIESVISGSLTTARSTTGDYRDFYGTLKSAATNSPRQQSDGWLVEGSSTNSFLYSDDFSNAAWLKVGGIGVTADSVQAPDQATAADTLTSTSGLSSTEFVRQDVVLVDTAQDVAFSIYAKQSTSTVIALRPIFITGGTTIADASKFNLSTGVWDSTGASHTVYSEVYENGWYRLSIVVSNNNTGNTVGQLRAAPDSIGDIFVFRAQYEDSKSVSSSSISTTTTAVTRSADFNSAALLNNLPLLDQAFSLSFRLSGFTVGANSTILEVNSVGGQRFLISSAGSLVVVGAASYTLETGITGNESIVITYDGANFLAYVDGVAGTPVAGTINAATSGSIYIGSRSATEHINANIIDLRIYDFEINASEAAYLSN